MRIFIVGDFETDTGPAIVNKTLKKQNRDILYSKQRMAFFRIIELLYKGMCSDIIIFSGLSKINILGLKFAKLFNKKAAYLMHGYAKYENEINGVTNYKQVKLESDVLELAPNIICVSKLFKEFMCKEREDIKEKFDFAYNPLEYDSIKNIEKRNNKVILSVGGGIPRKNIKKICQAIELLDDKEIKFIVIGKEDIDTEEIKKYKFVKYIKKIAKSDMKNYYRESELYIQNSSFETFGLAVMEALSENCKLLISDRIGCKDLIGNLMDINLIHDTEDINEIAIKIKQILSYKTDELKLKSSDSNGIVEKILNKNQLEKCYER